MELLLILLLPMPVIGIWALFRAVSRGPKAVGRYAVRRAGYVVAPKAMRAAGDVRALAKGRYAQRLARRHTVRGFRRARFW